MSRRSPRNGRCAAASSPSLPHDNMDASSCRFGQGVSLTLQIPPLFNPSSIAEAAGFTNCYLALLQANVDGNGGPDGRYPFRQEVAYGRDIDSPRGASRRAAAHGNLQLLRDPLRGDVLPRALHDRKATYVVRAVRRYGPAPA